MRHIILFLVVLVSSTTNAQELYSVTEPASNMPAGSLAFRLDNSIMDEVGTRKINYHFIPGVRIGLSKKLMLNFDAFFSNRSADQFVHEGGSVYAKYRFLSNDAIQRHFRMAAFAKASYNNSDIHQEEINMQGHNSGYEVGIVATQLLRKVALSSAMSIVKAYDNGGNNKFPYGPVNSKAVNYTLSFGKLMLPKEYTSYRQTNVNLMVETLSQANTGSGKYYIDVAPVVQLIIHSQSRIDVGYRKQVSGNLLRTSPNGFLVRLEHNLFDVF